MTYSHQPLSYDSEMDHAPSRSELRRAELVGVARELLVADGLESFAMRTVAARAGMRLGNLQYYFPTRDDLLEEVIRAEFAKDLAALADAFELGGGAVDLERLTRLLIGNWCSEGGYVFLALASLAYHGERFRSLNREIYEAFHRRIGAVIRRVDASASRSEVRNRALLMTSLLDGLALQIHAVSGSRRRTDQRVELVARYLQRIALGEC